MTVAELLARSSSRELSEWWAYYSIGADDAVMADLKRQAMDSLEQRTRKKRR